MLSNHMELDSCIVWNAHNTVFCSKRSAYGTQCCMDPDLTWRSGRGYPLVVHHWANLQSVHGLRGHLNLKMQTAFWDGNGC